MRARSRKRVGLRILLIGASILAAFVAAAGLLPPRNPLTPCGLRQRTSAYVPMPDGTRLAVRVALPTGLGAGGKVPAVMESTRYFTWYARRFILNLMVNCGIESAAREVEKRLCGAGYAFVAVDARGSGASFGARPMEFSREERADLWSLIDWISRQPWSDGRVASYGVSYSGNTAELAVACGHPALAAAMLLYSDYDPFTSAVMPGGLFNEEPVVQWGRSNIDADTGEIRSRFVSGPAPVDGDRGGALRAEARAGHRTLDIGAALASVTYRDDEITPGYTADSLAPWALAAASGGSKTPLFVRLGWMDAGTVNGALERFLERPNDQRLVIGPWSHGGWHAYDPLLTLKGETADLDSAQIEEMIAFLDDVLGGKGGAAGGKSIRYYTFGEGKWKTSGTWPVAGFNSQTLYFHGGGRLSAAQPEADEGSDRYVVDYGASTGPTSRWLTNFGGGPVGYPDRAGEDRKLLVYTGEPLARDVEITGVPVATLEVSSDAADCGLYVYLEDVSPDGSVAYLTEGQLRALHREQAPAQPWRAGLGPLHSFLRKDGKELAPGAVAECVIGMHATSVLLKKGHRIRVAVAGHDTATFARVPRDGTTVIDVQRNDLHPSRVDIPMRER